MNYTQVRPFDTSKGGNIPNLCLANVVRGYSIANKYGSAWMAWGHTEQHTDQPPPNLDIPIYYSYTTTIDGVTANYGHINVRLKNGTVWSDGNIYASIQDYTSKKVPKFVGWGESVNDFKIIEGVQMPPDYKVNRGDIINMWRSGITGDPPENYISVWINSPWKAFMYDLTGQGNWGNKFTVPTDYEPVPYPVFKTKGS